MPVAEEIRPPDTVVPVMLIAGEPSGDALAAELVEALREGWRDSRTPAFFGAGGGKMAAAGVELICDLASHAVVGLVEVLKNYGRFRRIFNQLLAEAVRRRPAVVILVDYSGFNRRFAAALRRRAEETGGGWRPNLVYYVSPQVWASRPGRAKSLERDLDLLLSIFPFEKAWYAARAPKLRVEFVGHPIVSRHAGFATRIQARPIPTGRPGVLLLPGSRLGELRRHLPVMLEAAREIDLKRPSHWTMILPDERLRAVADEQTRQGGLEIELKVGGLAEALIGADLAIASTGTVTMECAFFRVPTVALYKTSWSTFQIGKRVVTVRYLAMPNLLADEIVFPEFVQHDATGSAIAGAALELVENPASRAQCQDKLARITDGLGPSGASLRAAGHILELIAQ